MTAIDKFHEQHETDENRIAVNGRDFRLLVPQAIEAYIDPEDPEREFPLWAKIWEASLVLADFLARQKPDPAQHILEIGSGLGLVGIVASTFGHRVTSTEHDHDALAFARANARENGAADLIITDLDWNGPTLTGKFDRIVGSEVTYNEERFDPLLALFQSLLKPGGEIVLTAGMRKSIMNFLDRMQEHYTIKVQKRTLRSEDSTKDILLCVLTP